MNKIGFRNFRKFTNLEPITYGGITFLVGRNNSGKSTIIKSLLLIDNYFKSGVFNKFNFNDNHLKETNIVTYGRALNKVNNENYIKFTQNIKDYQIDFTITVDDENKSFATVHEITINDNLYNTAFTFNFNNNFAILEKKESINDIKYRINLNSAEYSNNNADGLIELLKRRKEFINLKLSSGSLKKSDKIYIEYLSEIKKIDSNINKLKFWNDDREYKNFTFKIQDNFENAEHFKTIKTVIIDKTLSKLKNKVTNTINTNIKLGKKNKIELIYELVNFYDYYFNNSIDNFLQFTNESKLFFIGINHVKQTALFSINDKENALSQTIHEYQQLNISEGEEEHRFILKWMKEFEIGNDFLIKMHAGEAYQFDIISDKIKVSLADKGTGSIQAMFIILKIACLIRNINLPETDLNDNGVNQKTAIFDPKFNKNYSKQITVVIEEAESNLHPALQSKLADFFLEVHLKYKIDFIIETHSEYLIRRSQVIVAENELEVAPNENPFCVHYFPKENNESPYQLNYQADGTFDRNFGTGFFDAASLDTLKLVRIKREKKA